MGISFAKKNVLITGSSMGLGQGLSRCFAQDGANLALADHPQEKKRLDEWADELQNTYGIKTWTFCADLTDPDGPERLHEEVIKTVGEIHTLVNNAGMCWFGNFHEMPFERLEKMILLNSMAYAKLSLKFLDPMIKRDEGGILNVSSISAFQAGPMFGVYAATKSFIQSLSEAIRMELPYKSKVIVSTLNPPFMNTHLIEDSGIPNNVAIKASLGYTSVEKVAKLGFNAFKNGKNRYVPGFYNRIFYKEITKFLPQSVIRIAARVITHK